MIAPVRVKIPADLLDTQIKKIRARIAGINALVRILSEALTTTERELESLRALQNKGIQPGMSKSIEYVCSSCGINVEFIGMVICPVCDPDITALMSGKAKKNTPMLCPACGETHIKKHKNHPSSPP